MKRLVIGQHVVEYVAKATNEYGNFGAAVGIGLQELREGRWEMIAGVAYGDYNGPNCVAHIASDRSGRWMTKRYLWTIFDYPYNQLRVNRITCMIGPKNAASINLCERLGFERETTLQGANPDGDLLIYRQWKKDCRFLVLNCKEFSHAQGHISSYNPAQAKAALKILSPTLASIAGCGASTVARNFASIAEQQTKKYTIGPTKAANTNAIEVTGSGFAGLVT